MMMKMISLMNGFALCGGGFGCLNNSRSDIVWACLPVEGSPRGKLAVGDGPHKDQFNTGSDDAEPRETPVEGDLW